MLVSVTVCVSASDGAVDGTGEGAGEGAGDSFGVADGVAGFEDDVERVRVIGAAALPPTCAEVGVAIGVSSSSSDESLISIGSDTIGLGSGVFSFAVTLAFSGIILRVGSFFEPKFRTVIEFSAFAKISGPGPGRLQDTVTGTFS